MPKPPARKIEQEQEILAWIEDCLGQEIQKGDFAEILKNGVILCQVMNKIEPGSIKKIAISGTPFILMENIQAFQKAMKRYGVPDEEIFQTADLFEARNIAQVTLSIQALARCTQKHPEYKGPKFGPKMAEKNQRNFTDEQIRQLRDSSIGLQAGQNKGATQAGLGPMGNTRHM